MLVLETSGRQFAIGSDAGGAAIVEGCVILRVHSIAVVVGPANLIEIVLLLLTHGEVGSTSVALLEQALMR